MSYIPLEAFQKRKKIKEEKDKFELKTPDKRRFREKMGYEESIKKNIISEFSSYGVSPDDIPRMLREFKRVNHYQTLNPTLFLITYFYFSSERNLDFGLVAENFDYDFQQIKKNIYQKGLFGGRRFTPVEEYKFRQDFIMYMFMIWKSVNDSEDDTYDEVEDTGQEVADFGEQFFEPLQE